MPTLCSYRTKANGTKWNYTEKQEHEKKEKKKKGKCHLYADTKQKNRTANGTSGYEKEKKRRRRKKKKKKEEEEEEEEESIISMLIQITEQSMVPMVVF